MKVEELFEMPRLEPKELPTVNSGKIRRFNSNETLKVKYNIIAKFGKNIVGISKDSSYAFIGEQGTREDNVKGAYVLGTIDFKKPLNISSIEHIEAPEKVLQVDGVEISKKFQRDGIGYYLYLGLIKAGYVVISDNLQYLGGKAIWKKIAKLAINNNYKVYISDDTELRMKNGQPEVYDGSNIDDAEIWSLNNSKVYTVLVAIKQ
jgi:hypothetical protein